MATSGFGLIAARVYGAVPPSNTTVEFQADGTNGSWPVGTYRYANGAWIPVYGTQTTNLTTPATSFAVEFGPGKRVHVGTVNANINITLNATGAIPFQVRQMLLTGDSNYTITFSGDFSPLNNTRPYSGQTGIVNIISLQYLPNGKVVYDINQVL
jgi:hypothetical protein